MPMVRDDCTVLFMSSSAFAAVFFSRLICFSEAWGRFVYKLNSRCLAGKVYPHEIGFQETRTNHRKLDSQAALSHRARGRAVDGLRTQAWPLRASRRNDDPGRLSARPASLRGLRPAMAADRAIRGVFIASKTGLPACTPSAVTRCGRRVGEAAKMPFPIHPHMLRHACGFKLANDGHDARARSTTSGTRTSSTRCATPKWRPTVSRTFGEAIE